MLLQAMNGCAGPGNGDAEHATGLSKLGGDTRATCPAATNDDSNGSASNRFTGSSGGDSVR